MTIPLCSEGFDVAFTKRVKEWNLAHVLMPVASDDSPAMPESEVIALADLHDCIVRLQAQIARGF